MTKLTEDLPEVEQSPATEGLRDPVMPELKHERPPVSANRSSSGPAILALVVVGLIILVLAALLFPVFSRAREAARRVPEQVDSIPRYATKTAAVAQKAETLAHAESLTAPMPLMIIKTAEIRVEVKRFQAVYDQAVVIAGSVGGYVTNSSAEGNEESGQYGTLTIRVPGRSFERVLDRISHLGKIESKKITGEDVTGEVVDIEARLRNKRAEERQYLEIMNRARRIPDIVSVSNELYRVRGEIEEAEGRLKYLKSSVAMSTVNVELNEKGTRKPTGEPSLWNTVTSAGSSLASTAKVLVKALIWLVVFSPFWAIPIGVWIVVRRKSAAR